MRLLLSFTLGLGVASACTVVYPQLGEVPSAFAVRFERQGKPLAGVRVSVDRANATSDADGVAKFSGVPVGHHTLHADFQGLSIAGYGVNVVRRRFGKESGKALKVVWDDQGFPVGRVAGRLVKHAFQGPDLGPIQAAKLALIPLAGGALQDAVSREDGSFDFEQTVPGDYVLRIDEGHLLLRLLEPDRGPKSFQIGKANTSCGTWLFPKS